MPSSRGLWMVPVPSEVAPLYLVLQKSLSRTCFLGGCVLVSASSGLLRQSLVQTCFCRYGLGLHPQRSLAQALSCGGPWLGPSPTEFSGSGLLPRRSQTCNWAHRGLMLRPTSSVITPLSKSNFFRKAWWGMTEILAHSR